jgi:aldehyde dehydrogenase (NAD(P)+)
MDALSIDRTLEDLTAAKQRWATLPIEDKIGHLEAIRANAVRLARPWVEAAVEAKGLSMDDPLAGEEWTSGPYSLLALVNDLLETLRRLVAGRSPIDGHRTATLPNGQVAIDVFPTTLDERILYSGITAQVWMEPGVDIADLPDLTASFYRDPSPVGNLAVVLAAGNIASIAPLDVIHEMFNEGKVVVLKMNPVNDYLGPYFEEIFAALVDDGYLRFDYGGVDVGEYLTAHPLTDSIHVTGSVRTYEAIVFGSGPEGEENKRSDHPINERPIGAELGGVGPVIVVPGPWTRRDLRFHAELIVSAKMHNCGFNCIAAQVVIVPEGWEHTEALLDEIRAVYADMSDRLPYYPATVDRCDAAIGGAASVDDFGAEHLRHLVVGLDAADGTENLFRTEVFGPVLGVTSLPCPDVPSYLKKAVRFANHRLYGTLGANILIHPRTERRHAAAVQRALEDLEYGTIAVNTWTGVAYFMPKCTWGAFPGHTRTDIQSGAGTVHNALMLDRAQKSVVRGPFAPAERAWMKGELHLAPKPIYFVTNTQAHVVGERLIPYTAGGSKADIARIASAAIRG